MGCLGKDTHRENEGMSREKGPFHRGELIVFRGCNFHGQSSGLGGGFQVFFMFTYVY